MRGVDPFAMVDLHFERQRRAEMRIDAARALRLPRRDAQQPAIVEKLALHLQRIETRFLDPCRINDRHQALPKTRVPIASTISAYAAAR